MDKRSVGIVEITLGVLLIVLIMSSIGDKLEFDSQGLYNEMYDLMSDVLIIELSGDMLKDKELISILEDAEDNMSIDKLEPADKLLEEYGFGYMQYVGDPDMVSSWIRVTKDERSAMVKGEKEIEEVADKLLVKKEAYTNIDEIVNSDDGGFLIIASGLVTQKKFEDPEEIKKLLASRYPELNRVLSSLRGFLVYEPFYKSEEELESEGFVDSIEDIGEGLGNVDEGGADLDEGETDEDDMDSPVSNDEIDKDDMDSPVSNDVTDGDTPVSNGGDNDIPAAGTDDVIVDEPVIDDSTGSVEPGYEGE